MFRNKLMKPLFGILSLLILSSCGGGANDLSGTLTLTVTAPADSTQPGTAVATYAASDGRNPTGVEISFSTDSNIVAFDSTKHSVGSDGKATVTFRVLPVPVDTPVNITASTGGLSQSQVIIIKATTGAPPVTPPTVSTTPNSISFLQAQPTNITLKGMGGAGLVETSIVSFVVKDVANNPSANQTVDFSLNTTVGGLSITPTSAVSDASGIVRTIVNSGTIATPVRVTATVRGSNPSISVQSDQLVVSTGVPAQDGFSVSFSNLNSESFNHDGVNVAVIARLSDHFHNPVPDGTAVSFTTSAGAIQPSCVTIGGACTVNWISQNPRAADGRAEILAYAVGEEGFIDFNGNGVADTGEFTDTSEAYRDDIFNGVKDSNEMFIDFNSDGAFNGPDGFYNGILRPASVPSTVPKSKHVFSNSQIVMSTDAAVITTNPATITGPGQFNVTVTDLNGNTMASGTTVTITVPFGTVSGVTSFTVPQNTGFGQTLPVFVAATASPTSKSGLITIAVKSPGGLTTTGFVSISGLF